MEKWSLGYALLKVVVQFAFWLSHRKITVIGKENIPYGKPMIFAPNHQNALMDPLAVLCTNKTQPVWLARADIFNSPFVRAILRFLKILPVYRIRDGKENLGKNEDIFDTAIRVLEHHKAVGLFPEAAHSGKRQMLAHKKAVPRIAFLAESKNNFQLDLKVVPVGIYYSHYWHFNRSILVNYGEPIHVSEYQNQFEENDYKASLTLRQDIVAEVEKLILNITSKTHYDNYELLREIWGEKFAENQKLNQKKSVSRFYSDIKLIEKLEQKEKENPEDFEDLHQSLDSYRTLLSQYKISDKTIHNWTSNSLLLFIKIIPATLLFPVLLISNMLFILPFWIPRKFIQQKVNDPTFFSTFQFVAGLITHFLFLLAVTVTLIFLTHSIWITLLSILVILILGKGSFYILELWKEIVQTIHLCSLKYRNKKDFNQLITTRESCLKKSGPYVFD